MQPVFSREVTLTFDGSYHPSGAAYIGWCVFPGLILEIPLIGAGDRCKARSSLEAEWKALLNGLHRLHSAWRDPQVLHIRGDCQDVIGMMNHEKRWRQLYRRTKQNCLGIIQSMGCEWDAEKIDRNLNRHAHRLAGGAAVGMRRIAGES